MFQNTQMISMDFAFPDVCLTPTPAGPVPIPYPNIGLRPTAVGFSPFVFSSFMPAHNMGTTMPMTNGDNAGVNTGVASGMVMGPARNTLGSFMTLIQNMPATRFGVDMTLQNSTNAPGVNLVPSQIFTMILM